ncbi:MAG TPA: choice-of-anchor L domain-containing protein [Ramlibacter sp.]
MTFVAYDPAVHNPSALVSAIFAGSSGVALVPGSALVSYGTGQDEAGVNGTSLSFYDGSIASLNIGAGLLLTSGDATPPATNGDSGYSVTLEGDAGADAQLQATVNAAFEGAGDVQDVTTLQFQIQVSDPAATGLRFDVVFASDEYPEYKDSSFVDVAGVYVNGVNYALFNGSAATPLSVVDANIVAGNFRNNDASEGASANLPIEYDGVTIRLQVTAPLQQGTNTIKIAIGDTGDEILDSGIFVSGLQAVNYAGYGLAQQVPVSGGSTVTDTGANQVYQGDGQNNVVVLVSGQDVVDGGAGIDKVQYQFGVAGITGISWDGNVLSLHSGANASTLVNVERVQLGDGSLFALDTQVGEQTYNVYALLNAAFGTPSAALLSDWLADADMAAPGQDLGDLAQTLLNTYAGGASNEAVVAYLIQSIAGRAATQQEVQTFSGMIGTTFETVGDLFARAAMLSLNTDKIAGIVGSIVQLDPVHYV